MGGEDEALAGLARRSVDQAAALAVLADPPNGLLTAQEYALRVHVHHLVPLALGHVLNFRDRDDPGVLDGYVDPAEVTLGGVVESGHTGLVRNVTDEARSVATVRDDRGCHPLDARLVGAHENRCALLRETTRDGGTDPSARTRDDDGLT